MGVTNVPPDQLAQAWAQNLAGAQARMQAGAQAVTTSPGQAAAAQQATWLANVTASANRWAQNVAAVTTQQWQQAYSNRPLPIVPHPTSPPATPGGPDDPWRSPEE